MKQEIITLHPKLCSEYYRGRIGIINPYVSLNSITTQQARYAELALAENGYRFYINANYLEEKDLGNGKEKVPYSLKSGKEINWEFIPKGADDEYRKQLHRHNWIPFQAMAYKRHKMKYICWDGKTCIQIGYQNSLKQKQL